jgi:hypothetical protein
LERVSAGRRREGPPALEPPLSRGPLLCQAAVAGRRPAWVTCATTGRWTGLGVPPSCCSLAPDPPCATAACPPVSRGPLIRHQIGAPAASPAGSATKAGPNAGRMHPREGRCWIRQPPVGSAEREPQGHLPTNGVDMWTRVLNLRMHGECRRSSELPASSSRPSLLHPCPLPTLQSSGGLAPLATVPQE